MGLVDEPTHAEGDRPAPVSAVAAMIAGRYRVLALLGSGGMGTVYQAEDVELGDRVALKMLRSDLRHDQAFVERLRSEVRLARRVTHPRVARVYDIGEHEGQRFLTMELVDGEALGARIARDGPFEVRAFLALAEDLLDGLRAAHAAGVVHRDLKPYNVLLARDGRALLTDFGTASLASAAPEDCVVGTPSYMAPEQLEARFDPRSDVFGVGGVFYATLTGASPFRGRPEDRPRRAPNPRDVRPGLPEAIGAVVARCLEPMPEDRFPTADALREALRAAAPPDTGDDAGPASEAAASSAAAAVLRATRSVPREVLLRTAGDGEDTLAQGLRDEVADRLNERAPLHVHGDAGRPHEATAHVALRRDGETLLLDLRVVGADGAVEFWRESYASASSDAVGLARAAARGIERALAVAPPARGPDAPLGAEASALYLRGRAAFRKVWSEHVSMAAESYEQALALSPDHPLLLSALASARARLSFFGALSVERAREAAERALRVAPELAEAHLARATVHVQESECELAVERLRHAIDIAPGHVQILTLTAELLLELGAPAESIRLNEIALTRDPGNHYPLAHVARAHALLGRWDVALATLARIHAPHTLPLGRGLACRIGMWRRDRAAVQAIADAIRAEEAPTGVIYNYVTLLMATTVLEGRSPRADADHQRTKFGRAPTRRRRTFVHQIDAEMDAFVGDFESAYGSIEAAIAEGLVDGFWLERCPLFDDLRGAPRFEAARDVLRERSRRALAKLR